MDHQEAVRLQAVEKYLLDELSPLERDEFEKHFFDCPECAADLQTTDAMLDEAKRQLRQGISPNERQTQRRKFLFDRLWSPAFAGPVFACLLLVIGYQNLLLYPRLQSQARRVDAPEVIASLSLIGSNSRGGELPSVAMSAARSLLLTLDIPTTSQYSVYSCSLIAPSGEVVWHLPVSADQATDTVSIRVPPRSWESGTYTLLVQGGGEIPNSQAGEVARYRFSVHSDR